jgi:hypothetical protein
MNNYDLIKNFAQLYLQQLQGTRNLRLEDIGEMVDKACKSPGGEELSEQETLKLITELESDFQTVIGSERELVGEDEGWSKWLPTRRGEINWKYWDRYRKYMGQGRLPEDVLSRLDSSTDRVLGLMGNPNREGAWDRRGLVVGLVQSGKTGHYVGVINKAVDAGYKVIIVMTGFTESLRRQTQVRVEEGVSGYYFRPNPQSLGDELAQSCGVGLIEEFEGKVEANTSRSRDFLSSGSKNVIKNIGDNPIVFVVKKNVSPLKNLLAWVTSFGNKFGDHGKRFFSGVPFLLIDDESDVGSIDTRSGAIDKHGEVDKEHDPSKINKQIRKLLRLFDQSSYVGYTATPFANVLIHNLAESGIDNTTKKNEDPDRLEIGEDLFPRSFIVSLPTPSNHVGPAMIFGLKNDDDEKRDEGLPIIREIDDTELGGEKDEHWMPKRHTKYHFPRYCGRDEIPPSLRKAIYCFILVIAARRLRGDSKEDNSMLVHVTRFIDVQGRVYDQIESERQDIVNRLRNEVAHESLISELRTLWEDGPESFLATTSSISQREDKIFQNPLHDWHDVKDELLESVSSIEVRKINGGAGDVLDYEDNEDGLNVIAIGGDKLARGLTLNGLSVSYFLRCSKMYDTLMQMGRWFGYRPRYLDLCRLFTTRELTKWFAHISDASEELRDEFERMANSGSTPRQFGLRVQSHPTMMVTSSVKMKHGTTLQVSFQGTLVQTIDFCLKEKTVNNNWKAAENLIQQVEEVGITPYAPNSSAHTDKKRKNACAWSGIEGRFIIQFLNIYQEHEAARKVKTSKLKDYIQKQLNKNGLSSWTVLLSGGEKESIANLGSTAKVNCLFRNWFIESDAHKKELIKKNHFRISTLVNPVDELIGANKEIWDEALELDKEDWKASGKIRRNKKTDQPTRPSGKFIRQVKDVSEGLLILYPIACDDKKVENENGFPILGFAISFPVVDYLGDTPVTYISNHVDQQMEMQFHE